MSADPRDSARSPSSASSNTVTSPALVCEVLINGQPQGHINVFVDTDTTGTGSAHIPHLIQFQQVNGNVGEHREGRLEETTATTTTTVRRSPRISAARGPVIGRSYITNRRGERFEIPVHDPTEIRPTGFDVRTRRHYLPSGRRYFLNPAPPVSNSDSEETYSDSDEYEYDSYPNDSDDYRSDLGTLNSRVTFGYRNRYDTRHTEEDPDDSLSS